MSSMASSQARQGFRAYATTDRSPLPVTIFIRIPNTTHPHHTQHQPSWVLSQGTVLGIKGIHHSPRRILSFIDVEAILVECIQLDTINIFYIARFSLFTSDTGKPDSEGGKSPSHQGPVVRQGKVHRFPFIPNKKHFSVLHSCKRRLPTKIIPCFDLMQKSIDSEKCAVNNHLTLTAFSES
jgi:hypothetical protein